MTTTDTTVNNLIINKLTQAQYESIASPSSTELYLTPDNSLYRMLGEIVQSTIPLTDAGLHLLDGSLLSYGSYKSFIDYIAGLYTSGNYSALFETEANWQTAVTTYGVCGKFVYDSTNNTVRLPKITGFTEATITPSSLGDLTAAGLPNITGSYSKTAGNNALLNAQTSEITATGALYTSNQASTNYLNAGASATVVRGIGVDASLSNPIYGNSNTVQPQSIKVLYYIVVATTAKTDIQVDIDEIATDLNGKADTDLSNVPSSKAILTESYVNGTSWYRVYSDGWCEQGGIGNNTANGVAYYLLQTYVDTNYCVFMQSLGTQYGAAQNIGCIKKTSTSQFNHYHYNDTTQSWCWVTCGYIR